MSLIYINPPSSSPLPYLELKGDQLLGQIHELATCNNSHLSYSNLEKNPTYDESLVIDYSKHQHIKVGKSLSNDKSNNQVQGFQSSTQPQNFNDKYYGYSFDHSNQNKRENVSNNDQKFTKKLKPSKLRIRKNMTDKDKGEQKIHRYLEQQQGSNIVGRNNNSDNNNNNNIRVCWNCHTTTTPLWRSGPRGPKSLCNACGIRQRKARRAAAMMATTKMELAKDAITKPICVEAPKPTSPHQEKRNGEFDAKNHPLPLKKRCKTIDISKGNYDSNSDNNNGMMSSNKISYIKANSQRTLLHDEEEGAILLMALSCGSLALHNIRSIIMAQQ